MHLVRMTILRFFSLYTNSTCGYMSMTRKINLYPCIYPCAACLLRTVRIKIRRKRTCSLILHSPIRRYFSPNNFKIASFGRYFTVVLKVLLIFAEPHSSVGSVADCEQDVAGSIHGSANILSEDR